MYTCMCLYICEADTDVSDLKAALCDFCNAQVYIYV